jgi:hypothetical protein
MHAIRRLAMKSKLKRSNKMLIGAGIFLAVYLLISILFGTSVLSRAIKSGPSDTVTQVTVWRNW